MAEQTAQLNGASLPPRTVDCKAALHRSSVLGRTSDCPATASYQPCSVMLLLQADPLPKPPLEVGVTPHWLAVAGVQPATAENAQPRSAPRPAGGTRPAARAGSAGTTAAAGAGPAAVGGSGAAGQQQGGEAGGAGILPGLPLRHSLPDELQLYYDMVRRVLQTKRGGPLAGRAVATSLATDPGACLG